MTDSLGFFVVIGVAWLAIGLVLSIVMGRRGHDTFSWLLLGTVLGPLAVVLAVEAGRHDERLQPAPVVAATPVTAGNGPATAGKALSPPGTALSPPGKAQSTSLWAMTGRPSRPPPSTPWPGSSATGSAG